MEHGLPGMCHCISSGPSWITCISITIFQDSEFLTWTPSMQMSAQKVQTEWICKALPTFPNPFLPVAPFGHHHNLTGTQDKKRKSCWAGEELHRGSQNKGMAELGLEPGFGKSQTTGQRM